mmetsp:Transcript_14136/g.40414  ORF Transcript_14136/g.40414 Transcript_14136/m.40414 type:complete len:426 (+) Transcript_14136:140-1417(+)
MRTDPCHRGKTRRRQATSRRRLSRASCPWRACTSANWKRRSKSLARTGPSALHETSRSIVTALSVVLARGRGGESPVLPHPLLAVSPERGERLALAEHAPEDLPAAAPGLEVLGVLLPGHHAVRQHLRDDGVRPAPLGVGHDEEAVVGRALRVLLVHVLQVRSRALIGVASAEGDAQELLLGPELALALARRRPVELEDRAHALRLVVLLDRPDLVSAVLVDAIARALLRQAVEDQVHGRQALQPRLGLVHLPQRPPARELADGPAGRPVDGHAVLRPPGVGEGLAMLPCRELAAEEGRLPLLLDAPLLVQQLPQLLQVLLVPRRGDEAVAVQAPVGEEGVEELPQQRLVFLAVGRGPAAADAAPEVLEGLHDGHHDVYEVRLLSDAGGDGAPMVDDHLPQLVWRELLQVDGLARQHLLVGLLGL